MGVVPAYVRVARLAKLCGMDVEDMREMLRSAGILIRYSGQRFWVPSDRLRDTFPDAYAKLYEDCAFGHEESS